MTACISLIPGKRAGTGRAYNAENLIDEQENN
jgi:hypothetical protein